MTIPGYVQDFARTFRCDDCADGAVVYTHDERLGLGVAIRHDTTCPAFRGLTPGLSNAEDLANALEMHRISLGGRKACEA